MFHHLCLLLAGLVGVVKARFLSEVGNTNIVVTPRDVIRRIIFTMQISDIGQNWVPQYLDG